jgi:hypothetical protein
VSRLRAVFFRDTLSEMRIFRRGGGVSGRLSRVRVFVKGAFPDKKAAARAGKKERRRHLALPRCDGAFFARPLPVFIQITIALSPVNAPQIRVARMKNGQVTG